jgi:hypothetical protein
MAKQQFQPLYLFEDELAHFGLPDVDSQPNIMSMVEGASSLIDEYCGRTDGDGNGSLVYTTYSQRMYLPEGRNIFRTMFRPLVGLSVQLANNLAASGQNYYTGFTANTSKPPPYDNLALTPIVGCSGRYGYSRRGSQQIYPDLNYGANVLQIASYFGGPPQFTPIDITMTDVDPITGEIWVPAGLYLSAYTEIFIQYNSGFDPTDMPKSIKHATAALIRNFLGRGGGTTGMKSFSVWRVSGAFTDDLIDPTVERWLRPFANVLAY